MNSEFRKFQTLDMRPQNFCSQKLKRRIFATFGFNRTALRVTQPKLHSMFCALFLKITLSAAELMSFGHLGAVIWHRWTIICGVPSNIIVTPTERESAYTIDNVLKNWTDRVGYCMASWWAIWMKLLTEKIVLSNKKRNFRKYSVVFV